MFVNGKKPKRDRENMQTGTKTVDSPSHSIDSLFGSELYGVDDQDRFLESGPEGDGRAYGTTDLMQDVSQDNELRHKDGQVESQDLFPIEDEQNLINTEAEESYRASYAANLGISYGNEWYVEALRKIERATLMLDEIAEQMAKSKLRTASIRDGYDINKSELKAEGHNAVKSKRARKRHEQRLRRMMAVYAARLLSKRRLGLANASARALPALASGLLGMRSFTRAIKQGAALSMSLAQKLGGRQMTPAASRASGINIGSGPVHSFSSQSASVVSNRLDTQHANIQAQDGNRSTTHVAAHGSAAHQRASTTTASAAAVRAGAGHNYIAPPTSGHATGLLRQQQVVGVVNSAGAANSAAPNNINIVRNAPQTAEVRQFSSVSMFTAINTAYGIAVMVQHAVEVSIKTVELHTGPVSGSLHACGSVEPTGGRGSGSGGRGVS